MTDVLLGMQWGDEGKGKIVDYIAPRYDLVARFQGGPNAGHTLEFEGKKFVLHQIPSGIFQSSTQNIIGNGMVLDVITLQKELNMLKDAGFEVNQNLFVSRKAHIIIPSHRLLDAAYEKNKGDKKIGSTLKGIGPTYQDKTGRVGVRVGDLFEGNFKERYNNLVNRHLQILKFLEFDDFDLPALEKEFFEAVEALKQLQIADTEFLINKALKEGKSVLAEGAQGSLLDIDFGSYPFVTSSNTSSAGVCSGLGIPPSRVKNVYGIFKAYCTRVGSGPFPTELFDDMGEKLQNQGNEFGATTGRRRRCGWLDLPALRYAVMLNGTTELFMMKADVLNNFEELKVCTHYKLPDGTITGDLPYDLCQIEAEPVYETLEGWNTEITSDTSFENLPIQLHKYIQFIEKSIDVPITLVSLGPDRTQTIIK